ncbi:hypothetical protein [Ferruginibacter albus]|uniref:hypothetical protein n=1 Tax=Ferruginibacter albus TaxID=2875540 RepID=UPI001CC3E3CC|nr:hypothetical protein [Ferruginibacter albus]UAY53139.1 hypothetical protein K9M53_05550 [Ferruginibacter albus]
MEKQFLQYLLYIVLIEIREHSYDNNDKKSFWLSNLMHNVPLIMNEDEKINEAYQTIIDRVTLDGKTGWLNSRIEEFNNRNPDFKIQSLL